MIESEGRTDWQSVLREKDEASAHSPLRSRARTLMPFFRPRVLTLSSGVGTSMLRRGGMAIPASTLGTSPSLVAVPTNASPLRMSGEAFSSSNLVDQLALVLLSGALDHLARTMRLRMPSAKGVGELHLVELAAFDDGRLGEFAKRDPVPCGRVAAGDLHRGLAPLSI